MAPTFCVGPLDFEKLLLAPTNFMLNSNPGTSQFHPSPLCFSCSSTNIIVSCMKKWPKKVGKTMTYLECKLPLFLLPCWGVHPNQHPVRVLVLHVVVLAHDEGKEVGGHDRGPLIFHHPPLSHLLFSLHRLWVEGIDSLCSELRRSNNKVNLVYCL